MGSLWNCGFCAKSVRSGVCMDCVDKDIESNQNTLDLNELKWDTGGRYWYSRDAYNITPSDMLEYAARLEAELEGYKRANNAARSLHTTVVEALADTSMENAKLQELLHRYEWSGPNDTCPDCGWTGKSVEEAKG